ncbi:MAG: TetR/AcrR family transcriptional regulator [Pseudomonadota bacterium]
MSTRTDILAAARAAFEEGGEAGLSVRDVAARVGLTPMAIYRHFENKQALLDALVVEAIGEWRRRVADIPACAPIDWLRKIGAAYLEFALREPRKFEAAFLVSSATALRYPDDFLAGGSPAVVLQLNLIREIAPVDSQSTLSDILVIYAGLSQGLISLYRAGRIAGGERKFRALYGRALETCVRSFMSVKSP